MNGYRSLCGQRNTSSSIIHPYAVAFTGDLHLQM